MRDCYILENAALLHDIGKIGVPDSILLKPGRLTDDEWKVMRSHDRIGQEIIRSTFACEELASIVESHGVPFAKGGPELPLGARILAIADSFDSMVTDRVYRSGRSVEEALDELKNCAGEQFDPEIVDLFISTYHARKQDRTADRSVVNKKIALRLGMQIESLARALDEQDIVGLADSTVDLLDTTAACQLEEIAALASQLNAVATPGAEWTDCLALTLELLDCCRRAQRVHLESCVSDGTAHFPAIGMLPSNPAAAAANAPTRVEPHVLRHRNHFPAGVGPVSIAASRALLIALPDDQLFCGGATAGAAGRAWTRF